MPSLTNIPLEQTMPNRRNELSKQTAAKAQAPQTPSEFANEVREIRNARDLNSQLDEVIAKTDPASPARRKAVNKVLKENKKEIVAPVVPEVHTPQPVKEEKMATSKKNVRTVRKTAVAKNAKKATSPCQCGCGALTRKSFAPGHDQRLVGMIKRGELRSLNAFQSEFAKSHGIKLGEKRPAPKAAASEKKRKQTKAQRAA